MGGGISCTVESTASTAGSAASIIRRVGEEKKKKKKRKQVSSGSFLFSFHPGFFSYSSLARYIQVCPVILDFPVGIVHSVIGGSIGGGSP